MLDSLYGQVMRVRRVWSETHPDRRRALARPVISVGNLSVGGTGKSPVVAAIARWLIEQGERPSILSRGYGRADAPDGVVVVSDREGVLASVDCAGDEPLMLARQVPGAAVCVSPDRYLAGSVAERTLGCTIHLLDDGFQHVQLARDLDVLVTTLGEIPNGRVLPAGRLREPIDMASRADVLVVSDATAGAASAEAWLLGISLSCGATRSLQLPRIDGPVLAVAGIAHPDRFFAMLRESGETPAATIGFPDHHRYTRADLDRIAGKMRDVNAVAVLTTEKDVVRFEALGNLPFPLRPVPLGLQFDPPEVLFDSVRAVLA
ncbi:MAG: tetraacyldisaccharide 4'-kinase [Vicinamibacterales bacterium]